MQDPAALYRLETDVDLSEASAPVLVVALAGFLDAGSTQRLLVQHLMATLDHRVVATFDIDQLLDYRGQRPLMTFDRDHWSDYDDPSLALYRFVDGAGTSFLLLAGPEPDYQWERTVAAVTDLSDRLGVKLTATAHGIPMAVPHTRPVEMSFHSTDEERRRSHRSVIGRVGVPGSLVGLLGLRLGELGRHALGYAVHVPHYLSQTEYPTASVAVLEALAKETGLTFPDSALRLAAAETMRAGRTHSRSAVRRTP